MNNCDDHTFLDDEDDNFSCTSTDNENDGNITHSKRKKPIKKVPLQNLIQVQR